jgi:hypothetical protein
MGSIEDRSKRIERHFLWSQEEVSIGPTEEERALGRVIRRNPMLRKIAAYSDDPLADLRNALAEDQLADLTEEDRRLLEEYLAAAGVQG